MAVYTGITRVQPAWFHCVVWIAIDAVCLAVEDFAQPIVPLRCLFQHRLHILSESESVRSLYSESVSLCGYEFQCACPCHSLHNLDIIALEDSFAVFLVLSLEIVQRTLAFGQTTLF